MNVNEVVNYIFLIILTTSYNFSITSFLRMRLSEIIKQVIENKKGFTFRPNVLKLQAAFDCVIDCMQECWSEDPENRPDFKSIRTKLRPMRRGM